VRDEYKACVAQHGPASATAQQAYRKYRGIITRAVRRAWEDRQVEGMIEELRHRPKSFWESYIGERAQGGIELKKWGAYFSDLFGGDDGMASE
jgi:hypothetical protein